MVQSIFLFFISFLLLWIGSGIAVSVISKVAHSLRMSSFFVSFFVLGLFTSIAEITVGISAHINNEPEIFVGNLIGGSVVLFLLVIPLLAAVGDGIKLSHSFDVKDLISAVVVVGFPAFLSLDNEISYIDALVCIIFYCYFIFTQQKKAHSIERVVHINIKQTTLYGSLLQVLGAVILIFIASTILVNQTKIIGELLGISPFVISVLVISIGTNIPEISIAVRAILAKRKDIAFGDYLGSATLNTLELGILSIMGNTPINADGSNYSILIFLIGLGFFVYFAKTHHTFSRQEGAILLAIYGVFVICELVTGPGWNIFH